MAKITIKSILLLGGLTGFISSCLSQSIEITKPESNKTTTCSHCGKTTCNKTCSSSPEYEKNNIVVKNKILPSCSLDDKQFADRVNALNKTIFSKAKAINNYLDGYDIVFEEPKEFAVELIEMVNFERSCCSDFTWALVFEPNNKATHLQVYGSEKVKSEMRNAFKSFGLENLIK